MLRYQQKHILDMVQTLFEVNDEIKRLVLRGELTSAMQLLVDSQDFVIQIGTYIEMLEGEGTQTVTLLENLHEVLYKASVEIGKANQTEAFIRRLRKEITKIEKSVKTELKPNRIEIAFLPYKASMWDSLESIWCAAKNDPKCDAYVVPIPYYDKLPDGAFGEMHYEGTEYPGYVPVVDWREYNIEARHPDVVFIHNPYDDDNYVTSVHPDYYSSKLRNLTDFLVYVPYFVVSGGLEAHFSVLPACKNAHLIVVQSEKIREVYIQTFKKAYGTRFGEPANKFVALGSPKLDKVVNSERADFALPDKWNALLVNSDGTRKNCILYNTTVGAILAGEELYLKKIRSVLDTFRERDDVVLWWRPHPLSETTYESMRPELLEAYRETVGVYKSAGFGIYDDTSDLHRAIAWSDGYYGDRSSLVALYEATGKPMLGVNTVIDYCFETIATRDYRNIYFLNMSFESSQIAWAYSAFFNALYKLDLESHTARICYIGKGTSLIHSYIYALSTEKVVFLLPFYSDKLVIFDKFAQKSKEIILDSKYAVQDSVGKGYKLSWGMVIGEKVLMFGNPNGILVEYDLSTDTIIYNTSITSLLNAYPSTNRMNKKNDVLRLARTYDSTKVWVFMRNDSTLLQYDVVSSEHKIIGVLPQLNECENLCFDEKYIWLIPKGHKEILRWNHKTGETVSYSNYPGGLNVNIDKILFACIVNMGESLLLLPRYGNMAVCFDKTSGLAEKIDAFDLPQDDKGALFKFDGVCRFENKIFAFSRWDKSVYAVDISTMTVEKQAYITTEADYCEFIRNIHKQKNLLEKNPLMWESWFPGWPLGSYLDLLKCSSTEIGASDILENHGVIKNAGVQIYEYVKSDLSDV